MKTMVNVPFFNDRDYIFLLWVSFWLPGYMIQNCPAVKNVIFATENITFATKNVTFARVLMIKP